VAKGNIVYVADSTSAPLFGAGVFTIDVTDPSNAVILGRSKIGSTYSLALSENALFATGRGHLTILDLEDPARPVIRGAWKSSLIHRDLDLAGDHAVLASVGEGLHVIDIKEPTAPVLAGTSAPSTEDARGISVRGGTGLVAGGSRGLILLDVANPTLIREQTRYVPGGLTDD
jgi:hypothetical protein